MAGLLLALALFVRLPITLDYAVVDETRRWIPRTINFWDALRQGRWEDTYQSPHPGVSLMWSAGLIFEWSSVSRVARLRLRACQWASVARARRRLSALPRVSL